MYNFIIKTTNDHSYDSVLGQTVRPGMQRNSSHSSVGCAYKTVKTDMVVMLVTGSAHSIQCLK